MTKGVAKVWWTFLKAHSDVIRLLETLALIVVLSALAAFLDEQLAFLRQTRQLVSPFDPAHVWNFPFQAKAVALLGALLLAGAYRFPDSKQEEKNLSP